MCSVEFDGDLGKDGAGIGIWVCNPFHQPCKVPTNVILFSYKLAFYYTNNEVEYEVLITGLKILKKLGARRIVVYGDSELLVKKFKVNIKLKILK